MESQKNWGMVVVAGLFAVAVIGFASLHYIDSKNQKTKNLGSTKGLLADWRGISDTPTTTAPTSQAISKDLYTSYGTLIKDGEFTAADRDRMLEELVSRHVTNPAVVPNVTLAHLNVSSTASVDTYTKLFAVIMSRSMLVKEYELNVFARTVGTQNVKGTPELQETATLYRNIAAALLVMEVPPSLATKHLEAIKSVGALAKAVENMATWKGDPIDALAEIDTFNKAEAYVQNSVNDLLVTVTTLQKKT